MNLKINDGIRYGYWVDLEEGYILLSRKDILDKKGQKKREEVIYNPETYTIVSEDDFKRIDNLSKDEIESLLKRNHIELEDCFPCIEVENPHEIIKLIPLERNLVKTDEISQKLEDFKDFVQKDPVFKDTEIFMAKDTETGELVMICRNDLLNCSIVLTEEYLVKRYQREIHYEPDEPDMPKKERDDLSTNFMMV